MFLENSVRFGGFSPRHFIIQHVTNNECCMSLGMVVHNFPACGKQRQADIS